jgi:pimeloyl-ACP methyl ester carboxylesterase
VLSLKPAFDIQTHYMQCSSQFAATLSIISLGIGIFTATSTAAAQPDSAFNFKFADSPGQYQVGFKVVEQYDSSRPFSLQEGGKPLDQGRPLQTMIWYPAVKTSSQKMKLGEFTELSSFETSFSKPVEQGAPQQFVHTFMLGTEAQSTSSTRDAIAQIGRFPVIIYAPSVNSPAFENIEICEYLASHGYVVIATPSMGASSRHMTVDSAGVNAEVQDISFLIDYAKKLPDADPTEQAVIGYSWGGTAALTAAQKDTHIKALVALDGSFRYSSEFNLHLDQPKIPLLFISRGETPLVDATLTDAKEKSQAIVLNDWTAGDLLQVRLLAISHIQFSSLYQRSERFKREGMQFVPKGYSLQDGAESYNWMARYILEFLNAYLKNNRGARTFLMNTPAENSAPSRLVTTEFRPSVNAKTPTAN